MSHLALIYTTNFKHKLLWKKDETRFSNLPHIAIDFGSDSMVDQRMRVELLVCDECVLSA